MLSIQDQVTISITREEWIKEKGKRSTEERYDLHQHIFTQCNADSWNQYPSPLAWQMTQPCLSVYEALSPCKIKTRNQDQDNIGYPAVMKLLSS